MSYRGDEAWRITGDPNRDVTFVTNSGAAYETGPDPMRPAIKEWILQNAIGAGIPP